EPGPAPLIKLAQATGLCGGMLVPRLLNPPAELIFSRFGSSPSLIMLAVSLGSIPSMPITMTFLPRLRETRLMLPTQYDAAPTLAAPRAVAAAARLMNFRRLTGAAGSVIRPPLPPGNSAGP